MLSGTKPNNYMGLFTWKCLPLGDAISLCIQGLLCPATPGHNWGSFSIWCSMTTSSGFLHFDLALLNAQVRRGRKSEINLPRVTKTPFLHAFTTKQPPYLGFCFPALQLGFGRQTPLPCESASVPAKSIAVCARTEPVSVQTEPAVVVHCCTAIRTGFCSLLKPE